MALLIKSVKEHGHIETLDISGWEQLADPLEVVCNALNDLITNTTSLKKLELSNAMLGNEEKCPYVAPFFEALCNNNSIEEVNLDFSSISGGGGVLAMTKYLRETKCLKWLSCENAYFTKDEGKMILDAVKANPIMKYLSLPVGTGRDEGDHCYSSLFSEAAIEKYRDQKIAKAVIMSLEFPSDLKNIMVQYV